MNKRIEYKMAYRAIREFFRLADNNDRQCADNFYNQAITPCYDPVVGNAAINSLIARRNAEWLLEHPESRSCRTHKPNNAQSFTDIPF